MSGKRFNPLYDPPTASSSEEDDVESSNGEEEETEGNSSSEVEEDESSRNTSVKKPQTALHVPEKQNSNSESESEEESDSNSDSETERKEPVANPRPSVLKFVTDPKDSVVKNHDSKKDESYGNSESKRSRETDGEGASRDVKKVKRVSEEETKRKIFRRIWSEDDEIMVLQGVIDYQTDNGVSPFDDMDEFYQLVKKSIGFDATKIQLKEKLRKLKKKYKNNIGKWKNEEEPMFSSAHDRKVFELSKVIWGSDTQSGVKSNEKSEKKHKSKRVASMKQEPVSSPANGKNNEEETANKGEGITESDDAFVKSFLIKSLARYGVDDLAAQHGWSRLASEDKKRFEEQWKTLQLKEFEFYSQKSGFVHEVLKKMAEAFRSSP